MTDKKKNEELNPKATRKLIDILSEKRYSLTDIGLKNKQAFDWTKQGLFLEERESKFRRKYNAVEYVWLNIIKELRGFGLSIMAIKNLKSFLLVEIDMKEFILSFAESELEEEEVDSIEFHKYVNSIFGSNELDDRLEATESKLINTVLSTLIVANIISPINTHLLITKDGDAVISDGEPFDNDINIGDILNAPYISFPLRNILVDFVNREDLLSFEEKEEILLLNEQEEKVLNLLRQGNLLSLSVRFDKKNEIKLIETEENIDLSKVQGRLADYIMRNKYHTITYKTQDGKIINMRRKTYQK